MGYMESISTPSIPTLRHNDCQLLLDVESRATQCGPCVQSRSTLASQSSRQSKLPTASTSHVNYW